MYGLPPVAGLLTGVVAEGAAAACLGLWLKAIDRYDCGYCDAHFYEEDAMFAHHEAEQADLIRPWFRASKRASNSAVLAEPERT